MQTLDEKSLRLAARDAVRRQALPRRRPDHTYGGPGNGTQCPICGDPLGPGEMAFDLEFGGETDDEPFNIQMHVRCFAAWELERDSVANAPRASGYDVFEPHSLRSGGDSPTLLDGERKHPHSRSER